MKVTRLGPPRIRQNTITVGGVVHDADSLAPLTVKEVDGTPTVTPVNTLAFDGATVTDDTGGQATVTIPPAGITVEDEGTPLTTAADTLDFVGAGVVASGTGTTKTVTISGASVADILDLPTAETDDTLVLAPDGAGGVEFRAETGGGGGSGYDLDTYSIDGTYGDDFTGSSLSGIWTRRNYTSGAETYQVGKNATYMRIAATGRAAGDGYLQTAPSGDWTFAMAMVGRYWAAHHMPWGICVLDSAGTGLGTTFYPAPIAFLVAGITTYTTYSGSFQQTPTWAVQFHAEEQKTWQYLRKSGTDYFGAYSFDGELWSPETPAFSSSITVDRIGMLIHPLGTFSGNPRADVDWFNRI
jgi:hypothetical protein